MGAIELIVDAYVRVGDRKALDIMLDGRQRLADQMRDRTDFDCSLALEKIDRDIMAITSGLARIGVN